MTEFIQVYGPWAIAVLILLTLITFVIYTIVKKPSKIKEWLIYACAQAEVYLDSATGAAKLLEVYDMFIEKFPVFSNFVSFERFTRWVDEALDMLQEIIDKYEVTSVRELYSSDKKGGNE